MSIWRNTPIFSPPSDEVEQRFSCRFSRGRRKQSSSCTYRIHLQTRRRLDAAMARVVERCPRRSVGRVLRRRDSRDDAPGAPLRALPARRRRHPWTWHRSRAGECNRQQAGPILAGFIAFLGVWLLFKSQLDLLEATVRVVTDLLWTASSRMRGWRGGDVRVVYYSVLAVVVVWGVIALRLAQPIVLLQIGANIAGVTFVIAAAHLLYINTRLLPVELRPPAWRRTGLVVMMLFYAFFSMLAIRTLL